MKLDRIDGLERKYEIKLRDMGIHTIHDLLGRAGNPAGRKLLASESKINEKMIHRWVKLADLFRIKGIAGHKAGLLEAIGVQDLRQLARQNPDRLYEDMVVINEKKRMVQRVPGLIQVRRWVDTAKEMTPLVK